MMLCNISSDKVHILTAEQEVFLERNGIEKVLGPALLDIYESSPFGEVLVINGPGGFTNLRVGVLTRNLVAHLLGLRQQTLKFFSCTKIDLYRFFVKKGVLPRFGYIYLGQKSMIWKYDFEQDSYEMVNKDQIGDSDSFCDAVSDEDYWKGMDSVKFGFDAKGMFLEWKGASHYFSAKDLGLQMLSALEAQYMVEI